MTAKQLYENLLVELNKVNAPSLLLEDYNYFINKAVNQYINKRYNFYDTSQQTTDDLRVLKATATVPVNKVNDYNDLQPVKVDTDETLFNIYDNGELFGATYELELPQDYLHMLNCTCVYYVAKPYKCYPFGKYWTRPATRLTADAWSVVLDNAYMCPSYRRPYYYIHNVNLQNELPTNIYNVTSKTGTDLVEVKLNAKYSEIAMIEAKLDEKSITFKIGKLNDNWYLLDGNIKINNVPTLSETETVYIPSLFYDFENKVIDDTSGSLFYYVKGTHKITEILTETQSDNFLYPRSINIKALGEYRNSDLVDKTTYSRAANPTSVRCEIRYGKDSEVFQLKYALIDYIKAPLHIKLTQEQVDRTLDKSQVLEFPDYVCQEIINELVLLVMENASDLRIQTHQAVTLSIAQPVQQLPQKAS